MPYYDIELSAKLIVLNLWVSKIEISFIIVFTPNLIEYKFRTCGNFFEFILLNPYLNILAFYISGFSPVSWHLERNNSSLFNIYNTEITVQTYFVLLMHQLSIRCS